MNIAFGALILLLLLLPGLLFRVAYLNVRYSGKSFKSTIIDETLLAVAPAFVIQLLGYLFVTYTLHQPVSIEALYLLIISSGNFHQYAILEHSIGDFLLYNFLLWIVAFLLGTIVRKIVRHFKLHLKYPILKFQNEWYHILVGTILDFPHHDGTSKNIDYVWVDVMTETKEGSYIYSGILKEFFLSKEEGLDRIYITNVRRRKMLDDIPEITDETEDKTVESMEDAAEALEMLDSRYYYMPGDFFVIPYAQIKNINIIYYKREEY